MDYLYHTLSDMYLLPTCDIHPLPEEYMNRKLMFTSFLFNFRRTWAAEYELLMAVQVSRNMSNAAKWTHVLCICRFGQCYIVFDGVKNASVRTILIIYSGVRCKETSLPRDYVSSYTDARMDMNKIRSHNYQYDHPEHPTCGMTHFPDRKHVHQNTTIICVHYHLNR